MIYRVQTNLIFDIEDEARDYYHDSIIALAKAITINPGTPEEEHSRTSWHTCTHTDLPPTDCVLTASDESP